LCAEKDGAKQISRPLLHESNSNAVFYYTQSLEKFIVELVLKVFILEGGIVSFP